LQKQNHRAGSVTRVPAPEIEAAVVGALQSHLSAAGLDGGSAACASDHELVARHLQRVTLTPASIDIRLSDGMQISDEDQAGGQAANGANSDPPATTLMVPWKASTVSHSKGILHSPSEQRPPIDPKARDALLTAIAKARAWVGDLIDGRAASFAEIAQREGKVERHIRLLAPLAFVSPNIVREIIDGSAPSGLTATSLAKCLGHAWKNQAI